MPQSRTQLSASGRHPVWLLTGFWLCVVISMAVVIRRLAVLGRPSRPATSAVAQVNDTFSSHAALTASHIIPAAIFVLLAVVILLRPPAGKWCHRLFFFFGAITGLTAYAMSSYAIGGWVERSAVLFFNTWFLISLARAYGYWLRDEPVKTREWVTRAVGTLLGIATTRPVMGAFFATSSLTHLSPSQFFGVAFWIGFSINVGVVEWWLHSNRRRQIHRLDLSARESEASPTRIPVSRN